MHQKYESHNLDVLRSIAVCLVFGRHFCGRIFEVHGADAVSLQLLGVLGVWFFFVHTSLVLMFSLEKQARSIQGFPAYLSFIMRRVFRIDPLSIAAILLASVATSVWGDISTTEIREVSGPVLLSNVLLIQNLFHYPDVIGPLWSLPIEMQMYLFLPLLWRLGNRIGWKWMAIGAWPLAVLLAIPVGTHHSLYWLGVVQYAPCFIPGVVSYLLWSRVTRKLPSPLLPILLVVLMGIYLALGRLSQTGGSWIICLALGISLPWIGEIKSALLKVVCSKIAKYSYGIYLFHEICIPISARIFGTGVHWAVVAIVSALSTGLISVLAYHVIEEPLIHLGSKMATRLFARKTISLSTANSPIPG